MRIYIILAALIAGKTRDILHFNVFLIQCRINVVQKWLF